MDTLNAKQQAFVAAYIANGWNGTRAAIAAGYKHPGVTACKLLKKAKILSEINAALRRHQLSAKQVIARLSEIASASVADFMNDDGDIDWLKVRKKGYLLKKCKRRTYMRKNGERVIEWELELHDALTALSLIAKSLGILTNHTEIKADLPFEFVLQLAPAEMP